MLDSIAQTSRSVPRGISPSRTLQIESGAGASLERRRTTLPLPPRNRLLSALPDAALSALQPHLEPVELDHHSTLFAASRPIEYVYFPETAVVSLVRTLEDGGTVEVGTAGCEGMAGLPVFLGAPSSPVGGFTQIPGTAMRMEAATFARVAAAPGALHDVLLRYTEAFLTQVSQTAACNAAHLVEQRCARWLLMTHDRVEGDEFPLTHEFLAFMLSVRRAGVTLAMRALQDANLVRYTRGHVTLIDCAGLERASCECYRVVNAHFERVLGPVASEH
jgi:CRP-like cAMP-binding protein